MLIYQPLQLGKVSPTSQILDAFCGQQPPARMHLQLASTAFYSTAPASAITAMGPARTSSITQCCCREGVTGRRIGFS
jgi:hypothetical protein